MKTCSRTSSIPFLLAALVAAASAEESFTPLFSGTGLSGWVNVNGAPETWKMGDDGVLRCTGKPVAALRTVRQYENFILELEWRHLKAGGNAGIFVWASPLPATGQPFLRAIEVQVLDNGYDVQGRNEWYTTHGDIFPIHGSVMKPDGRANGMRAFPSAEHSRSSPEWNHYRLEARDGALTLTVNGQKVTSGTGCSWRKGYLGLESEGSPTEWRNVRLCELPSTGAGADQSAPVMEPGMVPLYTGTDFRGWVAAKGALDSWRGEDWQFTGSDSAAELTMEADSSGGTIILDVKAPETLPAEARPVVSQRGVSLIQSSDLLPGKWTRFRLDGNGVVRGAFTWNQGEVAEKSLGGRLEAPVGITLHGGFSYGNLFLRATDLIAPEEKPAVPGRKPM
jgi:hypothetical protein